MTTTHVLTICHPDWGVAVITHTENERPPIANVETNGIERPEVILIDNFPSTRSILASRLTKESLERVRHGYSVGRWHVKHKSRFRILRERWRRFDQRGGAFIVKVYLAILNSL